MKVLIIFLACVACVVAAPLKLVSHDGRVIEAELIEVDEEKNVTFEKAGKRFTLPFTDFAEESLVTISNEWTKILAARPVEKPVPHWKVLYAIYPSIDAKLGKRDIKSTMSPQRLGQFTGEGKSMAATMKVWSGKAAEFQVDIHVIEDPLEQMSPVRGSFWPAPSDVKDDVQKLLKEGLYDSIVVAVDNKAFGPRYAGLGIVSAPNGGTLDVTYALTTNPWSETFVHEWLHGSCAFMREIHDEDCPDPHDNGKFGISKQNGGWAHWYQMMMQGKIPRSETVFAGFSADAWKLGGPNYEARLRKAKRKR